MFGCDFVQVYGLTETTGGIPSSRRRTTIRGDRAHLLRSAGKPYPWVEMRVVDPAWARTPGRRGRRDLDPVARRT